MNQISEAPRLMTADGGAGDNSLQAFDVERVRADFPILSQDVYGKPLVYLDSAASAQKPRQVMDKMTEAMECYYSNVHRGVHKLSQLSTDAFEAGREKAAGFINAASSDEIVFTRGATEAINLVASSYGGTFLKPGDEVVLTVLEHHSNIVPWQLLRIRNGIEIKVAPVDDDGNFLFDEFEALLGPRTKLVAATHVSNAIGSILPIARIAKAAHARNIPVLVDGCQAVPHLPVDVQALDVDFYAFSGHKVYGPTGIGVLYGRKDLLNSMPPYQGGGEMISQVTFEMSTFKAAPHRFEAGTPAIVEGIGLGAALDYVSALDRDAVLAHEEGLRRYATECLAKIPGLSVVGQAREKASIIAFTLSGAHAHDIGTIVDREGVAIRAGHHCAQPAMERFGTTATARASFGIYNNRNDVDRLVDSLRTVTEIFGE
jgi:cysteine desulfurase/selenocysteine lyase